MDRFLKRMEMEKTMLALQQRLELASVKATNGWKNMSIGEIETRLPPTPPRTRKPPVSPIIVQSSTASTSQIPYEPPSPSRPWQLIDVLWQPLPPPSNARYPPSPTSPKKRSRADDHHAHPSSSRHHVNGHRRASSSVSAIAASFSGMDEHLSSPLRNLREDGRKKRSQSHSTHNRLRRETTSQDVDAAKALTSMLGGGTPQSARRTSSSLQPSPSLPLPPSGTDMSGTVPLRRVSSDAANTPGGTLLRTPRSSRSPLGASAEEPEDEDQDAAELMMFLAHSPSPAKPARRESLHGSMGSAARVLFADPPITNPNNPNMTGTEVKAHSNLAMAPPITASLHDKRGVLEA
ncbi:hypothetical protein BCR39DRAFT_168847 [Naematelia encephala]|uniref:Uncharacterized protein n=1 Tax=Naematelia encephala TaxID=71784 RepID=A0A1Y2B3U0_9TREE|nr:hypothetical protein BCR39DRAFT_168847 [Naematelia encephala]